MINSNTKCVSLPIAMLAVLLSAGCSTIGPAAVRNDRFNYNQAGAESTKEQLLLNLVRLRYGASIYVLEIGSMVGTHTLAAGASLSGWSNNLNELENPWLMSFYGNDKHATEQLGWGANLNYTDSPTITYAPIQGEEFADRLMTPIPETTIIQLGESGWPLDQLLECCVQWINGIPNSPVNSDFVPPDISRFKQVASLFRTVQESGALMFAVETDSGGGKSVFLHDAPDVPGMEKDRRDLRDLLGYADQSVETLKLVSSPFKRAPDELAVKTRSLLGVMSALALNVAVPSEHIERGWVVGRCSTEDEQDAADVTKWLNVQWSRLPRGDAFVQVFYSGYWFYVDRADARSKKTLALLDYLFSLQQTTTRQGLPVVTVPAK